MFFILETATGLGFDRVWNEIEPLSPQGKKIKKEAKPFLPGDEDLYVKMAKRLHFWLQGIKEKNISKELKPLLSRLKNIEGVLERLKRGDILDEGEFFSIKENLLITRKIRSKLEEIFTEQTLTDLSDSELIFQLEPLNELWSILNPGSIESERFYLRDEYDAELSMVRREKDDIQERIRQRRKKILSEIEKKLNRPIPLSGEIAVSVGDEELLDYLQKRNDIQLTRTTFSVYYFSWIPDESIKSLQEKLRLIEEREERIKVRVLKKLSKKVLKYVDSLMTNQVCLGELDWLLAKVKFAEKYNCVPAQLVKKNIIEIYGGRHLLIEAEVKERGFEYTPIDIHLKEGVTIITGSNMGGKTVNLRMVGLLIAMAQHGLYIPATKMRFSLRKFIYFSVGDDKSRGDLSTFGQEIMGLNEVLPKRAEWGLILIDELARGTNPEEGGALGKAIIKYLLDSPCITLITTHFTVLTSVKGIKHLKVAGLDKKGYELLREKTEFFKDKNSLEIINRLMDYRLIEAKADDLISQDAIRVASLLGLNEEIIKDAVKELKKEKGLEKGC